MESLLHYVEAGVKEGAKLIYGGKRLDRKGSYFLIELTFGSAIVYVNENVAFA